MSGDLIEQPSTVLRVGRKRTQHAPRVVIEDAGVSVRTRCGLSGPFDQRQGYVTCDDCVTPEPGGSDRG